MADILAGMEKPRFRLGLVYRLSALGLSPGDGEAQVLFYEFRYCILASFQVRVPRVENEIGMTESALLPWMERVCQARRAPRRVLQQLALGGRVGFVRRTRNSGPSVRGPGAWRWGLNRQAVCTDFTGDV
ncbi:hypothetical protein DEO72_LG2g3119 [Vigna unguiculata]|uniref:Uncharacterized protein n=1 Tax=Vigna unguiculata TaxID=3917 RepID=A0A4D6L2R6_VIGUN|nr:hypothetical protein DEO72_LG2g3119 [Vigna unguiculata]